MPALRHDHEVLRQLLTKEPDLSFLELTNKYIDLTGISITKATMVSIVAADKTLAELKTPRGPGGRPAESNELATALIEIDPRLGKSPKLLAEALSRITGKKVTRPGANGILMRIRAKARKQEEENRGLTAAEVTAEGSN